MPGLPPNFSEQLTQKKKKPKKRGQFAASLFEIPEI